MRPKQIQRVSTFHAHESILDTLLEVYKDKKFLGAAEISKRTGFYRTEPMNDAIVTGFLNELKGMGKVEHKSKRDGGDGAWSLTKAEYEKRREDSE